MRGCHPRQELSPAPRAPEKGGAAFPPQGEVPAFSPRRSAPPGARRVTACIRGTGTRPAAVPGGAAEPRGAGAATAAAVCLSLSLPSVAGS